MTRLLFLCLIFKACFNFILIQQRFVCLPSYNLVYWSCWTTVVFACSIAQEYIECEDRLMRSACGSALADFSQALSLRHKFTLLNLHEDCIYTPSNSYRGKFGQRDVAFIAARWRSIWQPWLLPDNELPLASGDTESDINKRTLYTMNMWTFLLYALLYCGYTIVISGMNGSNQQEIRIYLIHTVHTILSWPNLEQWQMGHTSDLIMIR